MATVTGTRSGRGADDHAAACVECGEVRPVCCDEGYSVDLADGTGRTTLHDDPRCATCCDKARHSPEPDPDHAR